MELCCMWSYLSSVLEWTEAWNSVQSSMGDHNSAPYNPYKTVQRTCMRSALATTVRDNHCRSSWHRAGLTWPQKSRDWLDPVGRVTWQAWTPVPSKKSDACTWLPLATVGSRHGWTHACLTNIESMSTFKKLCNIFIALIGVWELSEDGWLAYVKFEALLVLLILGMVRHKYTVFN